MASIADTIFGPTPEELEYKRRQEQEQQARQEYLAKLPSYGSQFGRYAGVARAGLETGEKLRGTRLFGESPSPEMERATVMKQILDKYKGQDMSSPEVLAQMSGELGQMGYPREAMQLMEQAKAGTVSAQQAQRKAILDDLDLQQKKIDLLKSQKELEGGPGDKMTGKMIDDFLGEAKVANAYASLTSSFEPEFVGYGVDAWGEAMKKFKRNFPMSEEDRRLTSWWTNYQQQINAIRNDLFGSALTETEKEEFLKAVVTPGMDAENAKRNLETQTRILRDAYNKKVEVHREQGWKVAGLEGAVKGSAPATATSGEWSIEVVE